MDVLGGYHKTGLVLGVISMRVLKYLKYKQPKKICGSKW